MPLPSAFRISARLLSPAAAVIHLARRAKRALRQAADLLETIVANCLAEGWEVPSPSPPRGRPLVALDPLVAIKVELYRAMHAAGISKAELARRMGIAPQQAQRLFDTNHASRIDQLAAAFAALGRRLVISSQAA